MKLVSGLIVGFIFFPVQALAEIACNSEELLTLVSNAALEKSGRNDILHVADPQSVKIQAIAKTGLRNGFQQCEATIVATVFDKGKRLSVSSNINYQVIKALDGDFFRWSITAFPKNWHLSRDENAQTELKKQKSSSKLVFPPEDPGFVIGRVLDLINTSKPPSWDAPDFGKKMESYLTPSFITAVEYGSRFATLHSINLYDAEFFTGQQSLVKAQLLSTNFTDQTDDEAVLNVTIAMMLEGDTTFKNKKTILFQMKRESGVWKIDDFVNSEPYNFKTSSVKLLFSNPGKFAD